jgi:hypothetical protein
VGYFSRNTFFVTSAYEHLPAILLSSFRPLYIFKGINILRIKDAALRKGLVVFQFSISIALIIGVIVVYSQLRLFGNRIMATTVPR